MVSNNCLWNIHCWLNCVRIALLSKFHVFCVPNSAFAESGSTPRVFSKVLKLTLTHNCWDNNSMRKARMCQDNLFINLLLSQGINEMSLKGLKIIGSLPMKFQLYALTGPLFRSYIKVCHRDFILWVWIGDNWQLHLADGRTMTFIMQFIAYFHFHRDNER